MSDPTSDFHDDDTGETVIDPADVDLDLEDISDDD